jgi:hypothetical protein
MILRLIRAADEHSLFEDPRLLSQTLYAAHSFDVLSTTHDIQRLTNPGTNKVIDAVNSSNTQNTVSSLNTPKPYTANTRTDAMPKKVKCYTIILTAN